MKPVPLDEFLAQMAGLFDGRRSVSEVERVLGPSASGSARLGLCRTLVERQPRSVIDDFYSAVRVAMDAGSRGRFAKVRDAYLRAHPPTHWVPTRAAEHFPAFLEQRAVPAELLELADFAWTRHVALMAPAADDASGLAVRHYTHAVRAFTVEVETMGRTTGRPERKGETWLIGRSPQTAGLLLIEPSIAALVVVQLLEDRGASAELPPVPRADLTREADSLHQLGFLSDKARAALEGWLP